MGSFDRRLTPKRSLFLFAAGSLVFGACSSDDEQSATTPDSTAVSSTQVSAATTEPTASELPDDVTAAGVILAATLIATGKIDDAVASGLVSPAEVDEARAAIESGTLDRWVALAEGE